MEELDDGKATINFMVPQSMANRFKWPRKKEKDTLPLTEILCNLLSAPEPASMRTFRLPEDAYAHAEAIMRMIMN